MSKKKIKESKEKIYSLAKLASNEIYDNKNITQQISLYENQIKLIKDFLFKCSKIEGDENTKKKIIYECVDNNYHILKNEYLKLKEQKNKISQKCSSYEDEIFDEKNALRQSLELNKIDNFILLSQLKEKDYQILKLKDKIKEINSNYLFSNQKKEIKVNNNVGCYYLDNHLETFSKKLMKELLYFNIHNTECVKLNTKLKKLTKKFEYYNEIVNIFEKKVIINIKNRYKEDKFNNNNSNNHANNIYDKKGNGNKISKKNLGNKKDKKINILTVSELFDINNDEGKTEAIIDEELHSDDEVIFEPRIKHQKKLTKGDNLKAIRSIVPRVDLSLINFNKKKVMNEADLYSFQNRKFKAQNVDEQIKEMYLKKKQILHKCKMNKKKLIAIKNFANTTQDSYKILKPLKLKTSVFGNCNDNILKEMNDGLNGIEEIQEEENDIEEKDNEENDDNLVEEEIMYTQRSFSSNRKRKLNNTKILNNSFSKNKDKREKQKENKKIKKKLKRAKSK